jgi:hypothetical protein
LAEVDGFGQDNGRAQGARPLVNLSVRILGDDGDPDRRVEGVDALEGLEAAQARHVEVKDHNLRPVLPYTQQRL